MTITLTLEFLLEKIYYVQKNICFPVIYEVKLSWFYCFLVGFAKPHQNVNPPPRGPRGFQDFKSPIP